MSAAIAAKYNRADASFVQAIQGAQSLISDLEAAGKTVEWARTKLPTIETKHLYALAPLLTAGAAADEAGLRAAAANYPLEAVALVANALDSEAQALEAQKEALNTQDLEELDTTGLPN